MIIVKVRGMDVDSELVRDVAKNYPFDAAAVLYLGPYIGYRDAPNPETQQIKDARDQIVADIEAEHPVSIETFSAAEQHEIMLDRFGSDNLPDWCEIPESV